jgi:cell division protein FtsQ
MQNWKKIVSIIIWSLASIAMVVLFVFAWQAKATKKCAGIQIELVGESTKALFMNEQEILHILNEKEVRVGKAIATFNLVALEKSLEQTGWIKNAELYIDNQLVLQVKIEQRIPIARVFSNNGNSFYVDFEGRRLPLRQLTVMRLPVFTGFTSDQEKLSSPDSLLLNNIVLFANTIKNDSFYTAQIAQVNIEPNGDFVLVPSLGDHLVLLGNTENLTNKLDRLYTFYKQVWVPSGVNAFQILDLRFDNQIVTLKKGMSPIKYAPGAMVPFANLGIAQDTLATSPTTPVMIKVDSNKKSLDSAVVKSTAKAKVIVKAAPKPTLKPVPKQAPKLVIKKNNKSNNKPNNKTLIKAKKTAKAVMPKKSESKTTN